MLHPSLSGFELAYSGLRGSDSGDFVHC